MPVPVKVSPASSNPPATDALASNRFGSQNYNFHANGAMWTILGHQVSSTSTIVIMKSTDNGNTWTEMDAAHEPVIGTTGFSSFFSSSQNKIYFSSVTTNSANIFRLFVFDLVAGTWSSFGTDSPTLAVQMGSDAAFIQMQGASFRLFYRDTSNNLKRIDFDGVSTWSAETIILNPVGYISQIIADPADNGTHLIINTVNNSSQTTWNYLRIDSSGTLTNNHNFTDNIVGFTGGNSSGSNGVIRADNVISFPAIQFSSFRDIVIIYRGTPVNNPTWSALQVVNDDNLFANSPTLVLNAAGFETCYWLSYDDLQNFKAGTTLRKSTYNGATWSASTTIYDLSVNPYPNANINFDVMQCLGVEHFNTVDWVQFDGSSNTGVDHFNYEILTTPPGPTCSLAADRTSITAGQAVILSWTTTNTPTSGSIDNGIGSVPIPTGSVNVSPSVTTTYVLTVANSGGSSTCQVTITVSPCSSRAQFEQDFSFFQ